MMSIIFLTQTVEQHIQTDSIRTSQAYLLNPLWRTTHLATVYRDCLFHVSVGLHHTALCWPRCTHQKLFLGKAPHSTSLGRTLPHPVIPIVALHSKSSPPIVRRRLLLLILLSPFASHKDKLSNKMNWPPLSKYMLQNIPQAKYHRCLYYYNLQ